MTRTFNRKMKMRDTFTKIFPNYNHEKGTCYTKSFSHEKHPMYEEDLEKIPTTQINR